MELEGTWVTDGGLETDLIFNRGVDLPQFAAFPLLDDAAGRRLLRGYYAEYAEIAQAAGAGLLLETPTWRANPDWGRAVGYDGAELARIDAEAVALVRQCAGPDGRVSGSVGPRGDGYLAGGTDPDEAAGYHVHQVRALADAGADLVHAMTMTEPAEAIGVVRAARAAGVSVTVSFTVETDGALPDGSTIAQALTAVEAVAPADWYGLNCAHPTHIAAGLDGGEWQRRIAFVRPNASTRSHAELDEADQLDAGDLDLLTASMTFLRGKLPAVAVLGGCCGTDSRHVAALWGVRPPR